MNMQWDSSLYSLPITINDSTVFERNHIKDSYDKSHMFIAQMVFGQILWT